MIEEPPKMSCAVCNFPLDHVNGAGFVHLGLAGKDGHVAVPVATDDMDWPESWVCDFCGQQPAPWLVKADDFTVTVPGTTTSFRSAGGGWSACSACTDLVRRKHWTQIASRAIQLQPGLNPATLRRVYGLLQIHMTGIELMP